MANIKSQIKRVKTNNKAQARNKSVSSSVKTAVRKFREAVAKGDAATTTTELRAASKALDVAVAKGVVHVTLQQIRSLQWLRQLPKPALVNFLSTRIKAQVKLEVA